MSCFWTNMVNCTEECGDVAFMGLYRNGSGFGTPTDTPDPFDGTHMWCSGSFMTVNGILSGHVVLVSDFAGCPMIGAPVNDDPTAPDTCDAATLIAFLQSLAVDTEFDVGAVAYSPSWTNADLGLSAPGFGVYLVDTDAGVMQWIVIAHTCY